MDRKETYTRYEKTRIISARSLQIAQGSPVLIALPRGEIDPTTIAKLEWEAGVIPIGIRPKSRITLPGKPSEPAKHAEPAKTPAKNRKK